MDQDSSVPIACVKLCNDTTIVRNWFIDTHEFTIKFNLGDGAPGNPFWKVLTLNDTERYSKHTRKYYQIWTVTGFVTDSSTLHFQPIVRN
jgi:hypothetical protein